MPFNNRWDNVLGPIMKKKEAIELSRKIQIERSQFDVYPSSENVLRAFSLCDPIDLKVVILGQDPYHTPNMAVGLAFGVPNSISEKQLPPSLKTIIKEVKRSTNDYNGQNDLVNWATQGVLLLNTALTVRKGEPNSHSFLWKDFTKEVIINIDKEFDNLIFMLWGKHAQYYSKQINHAKHYILTAGHPSPLNTKDVFANCDHFNKANEILKQDGKTQIKW